MRKRKGEFKMEKETKICTKCNRELPLENFRWKNKSEGRKHAQCKECQSAQERERYRNDLTRREKLFEIAKNQREKNFLLIEEVKSQGCVKCGEKRICSLDFHHIDPTLKTDNINHLRTCGYETLKKEIDKCVVLCANCHREFHHLEFLEQITLEEYLDR